MPFIQPLARLLFPRLCFACNKNSKPENRSVCIHCEYHITPTNYHLLKENPAIERFWGRVPVEHATTAFEFVKGGLLQRLIHQLKYQNRPEIGVELGRIQGESLKDSHPYNSIDYIIPVPLHPKKKHQRGYNQAAMFAKGLSEAMHKEWSEKILTRTTYTETQTKKSRMERFDNVINAFVVTNKEEIANKHILLVDDVITTGATLEACAIKLLQGKNTKVSILAIALAN